MQFTADHQSMLQDIMSWRRDVRHFKPDAIAPPVWAAVKAAVDLAPSVGNSQPWRMVEVTSPAIRRDILAHFTAENAAASAHYDGGDRAAYLALKLAGLREAPIQLAVFTDLSPEAGRGLGRQTMPETLHYSTVTAIHTLWLAARVHNLGVGWVSIVKPAAIAALLDVPPHWALTGYLCIGKPADHTQTPELEKRDWQARQPTQWLRR